MAEPQAGRGKQAAGRGLPFVEVRRDVAMRYTHLFGEKLVNGRQVSVEEAIALLYLEVKDLWAKALRLRRGLLDSGDPVRKRYALPGWEEVYEDPVSGSRRTFREIVQGLIDNFLGKETPLAWRLNELAPIPDDAHPLRNPGLELTGPWEPLDMAIKQINADVAAIMGPDDEDAAPPDFVPFGSRRAEVRLYKSRDNERRLLAGEIREVTVLKKGRRRRYRIERPRERWPTSFHRVPGLHLVTHTVTIEGRPAPAFIVDLVIHALNDYEALRAKGRGLYFYLPKVQTPLEATVFAKAIWRLERLMGAERPGTLIKFKALYEEANAGRFLPAIMWIWRHWLIGTNVGRWDYTASLIEMWKDERVLPDPQNGALMGMTAPHMMAYQRYNALLNLMAGLKKGELSNGAPIGGMAAVMLYPSTDPYSRHRHNPVALRAMKLDKLRERLIGLFFVPEEPIKGRFTLEAILSGSVRGRLYDVHRQSWVASPDELYLRAGNGPLRARLEELQAMLDAPEEWHKEGGKEVAPKLESGLTQEERRLFFDLGLIDEEGKITPFVLHKEQLEAPEKLLSGQLWGGRELWDVLYDVPPGEITPENFQHAFYMAANYAFQVLNGNLAAAIDDYRAFRGRIVRFMNDLATYRIFVSWLWTLLRHAPPFTRQGYLMGPALTQDGVIPAEPRLRVEAGTRVTPELFEQLWELHRQWTDAFFADYDRIAALRIACAFLAARKGLRGGAAERFVDGAVQRLAPRTSPEEVARGLASLLGLNSEASQAEEFLQLLAELQGILARAFGRPPVYRRELSAAEAARQVARLLKMDTRWALAEIRRVAPRFDRGKAPLTMDILRRQLLCPRYIQHSARVLFEVADKGDEQRKTVLDVVYYRNEAGRPLYRDEGGAPSREAIEGPVRKGEMPDYALWVHDYVYDVL
jgi:malate synthase